MFNEDTTQAPPPLPRADRIGLAMASLILGILAVCMSPFAIGVLLGVLGMVFGIVHLTKRPAMAGAMAGWGIGLSILGAAASIAFAGFYTYLFLQIQPVLDMEGYMEEDFAEWEGVRAPDFTVTTLEGEALSLSDLRGKRVILDLWATWCPPCVQEIPHFIELAESIPPEDLAIVGISDEDADTIREFAEAHGVNYAMASSDSLPSPYRDVVSIPTTFFIDRNGVIQEVFIGYHDLDQLRAAATAPDFEGEPLDEPPVPRDDLAAATQPLAAREQWSVTLDDALGLCIGDWMGDGAPELLVSDFDAALHIFDRQGQKLDQIPLPAAFSNMELGRHADGPRLLGYDQGDDTVFVVDRAGETLWTYGSWIGVNGAHWGDATGDGNDEMVVGMNGGGGLHLVSETGQKIWKQWLGNVWSQSFVRTPGGKVRIFATEAGGTVRIFDAGGEALDVLQPEGNYCVEVLGAVEEGGEAVYFLTGGTGRAFLCDESGQVQWSTPGAGDDQIWRSNVYAHGDITGDGRQEWILVGRDGHLVVASTTGERLAVLPDTGDVDGFAVYGGMLYTLAGETLAAYAFAPSNGGPANPAN